MDIDKLEAGPALDALVAGKVLGRQVVKAATLESLGFAEARGEKPSVFPPKCITMGIKEDDNVFSDGRPVPAYSSDIAAAWEILGKVQEVGSIQNFGGFGWRCEIHTTIPGHHDSAGEADTAPLAICRACLKAVL
jgi:hypothetical protein